MLAKPVPSIGYHECAYALRRIRDAPFIDVVLVWLSVISESAILRKCIDPRTCWAQPQHQEGEDRDALLIGDARENSVLN